MSLAPCFWHRAQDPFASTLISVRIPVGIPGRFPSLWGQGSRSQWLNDRSSCSSKKTTPASFSTFAIFSFRGSPLLGAYFVNQRKSVGDYDRAYENAAKETERLLAQAGAQIAPKFLDFYPAVVWEDQDECMEVRPEDIPL